MPYSDQQKEIHRKLILTLQQTFHPTHEEFKHLKILANLKKGVLENCLDMRTLIDKLLQNGTIRLGDYSKLKQMIKDAGCNADDILSDIEEAEESIRRLGDTQQTVPKTLADTGSDTVEGSPAATNTVSGIGAANATNSPTPGSLEKHKYPTASGFCLILNIFVEQRTGTVEDANNLKSFLESVNCRVEIVNDPDLARVHKELDECRDYLNSKYSPQYFFCAILSHGNKDGIITFDDKRIKIEDIIGKFKNDKMPGFVGKPKVFLVQACRGSATQSGHDIADDEVAPTDWSDIVLTSQIPTDADILMAFATTPGFEAYRREHVGSWFLYELTIMLKKHYKTEHLEEILISVRQQVAVEYKTLLGGKQMPCTSSTLTKRFYFSS